MPYRIYTPNQIADYFLARANPEVGDLISNLKLQKLCYYGAGLATAARGDDQYPLFGEQLQAWQHGPVVPSQYRRFSHLGAAAIQPVTNYDFSAVHPADAALLDDVYNFYGQYSAWKLRNMTHEESPWIDAYNRDDKTIHLPQLRNHFTQEMSPEYIENYRAQF